MDAQPRWRHPAWTKYSDAATHDHLRPDGGPIGPQQQDEDDQPQPPADNERDGPIPWTILRQPAPAPDPHWQHQPTPDAVVLEPDPVPAEQLEDMLSQILAQEGLDELLKANAQPTTRTSRADPPPCTSWTSASPPRATRLKSTHKNAGQAVERATPGPRLPHAHSLRTYTTICKPNKCRAYMYLPRRPTINNINEGATATCDTCKNSLARKLKLCYLQRTLPH